MNFLSFFSSNCFNTSSLNVLSFFQLFSFVTVGDCKAVQKKAPDVSHKPFMRLNQALMPEACSSKKASL